LNPILRQKFNPPAKPIKPAPAKLTLRTECTILEISKLEEVSRPIAPITRKKEEEAGLPASINKYWLVI